MCLKEQHVCPWGLLIIYASIYLRTFFVYKEQAHIQEEYTGQIQTLERFRRETITRTGCEGICSLSGSTRNYQFQQSTGKALKHYQAECKLHNNDLHQCTISICKSSTKHGWLQSAKSRPLQLPLQPLPFQLHELLPSGNAEWWSTHVDFFQVELVYFYKWRSPWLRNNGL